MVHPCLTTVEIGRLSVVSPLILTVPTMPLCNDFRMLNIFVGIPFLVKTAIGRRD